MDPNRVRKECAMNIYRTYMALDALNKPLVLLFSETWPDGTLVTLEGYRAFQELASPMEAQTAAHSLIDPEIAAITFYDLLVEAEIRYILGLTKAST